MEVPLLMNNEFSTQESKGNDETFQINWNDIDLKITVKKEGKEKELHILKNISGFAKSGETLAILGSSGAGKSTLLNILSGRFEVQKNMKFQGNVDINKEQMNWNNFKMICGFVMQTDIFLEFLTIREIFEYTAKLIYKDASNKDIQDIIDQVVKCLKLETAQKNIVGGNNKGISGGEKRRLNIGCELLKNPKILFLDEPTSGLDSYTGYIIAKILKELSRQKNMLILYTIHQPSEAISELFDRVMILEDGEVVLFDYYKNINRQFKQLEIKVPQDQNILEYSIELCKDENSKNKLQKYYEDSNNGLQYVKKTIDETPIQKLNKKVSKPNLLKQTWVLCKRNFFDYIRNPKTFKIRFIQIIFTGILFLLLYWQQADVSATNPTSIMNRLGALFFVSTNLFMLYANTSLAILCFEKTILSKEYQNGLYGVVPYFFAKILVEFPLLSLYPAMFASIIYFGVNFEKSFQRFALFALGCVLQSWLGTAVALILSSVAGTWEFAVQISPLIFVPAIFFSGFTINLNNIYFLLRYLQYISPVRYIFEYFVYNEFEDKDEFLEQYNPMKQLGFSFGIQKVLLISFCYFLGCLFFGLLFLKIRMKALANQIIYLNIIEFRYFNKMFKILSYGAKKKLKFVKVLTPSFDPKTAIRILQSQFTSLHNETLEFKIQLNLDPKRTDQNVRGSLTMPLGKQKIIAFIGTEEQNEIAKQKGVDIIVDEKVFRKWDKQQIEFDTLFATADGVKQLKPYARFLGPKGLFPNLKMKTLIADSDLQQTLDDARLGKLDVQNDEKGIIKCTLGRMNFKRQTLFENFNKLMNFISSKRPAEFKGKYIKELKLRTTRQKFMIIDLNTADPKSSNYVFKDLMQLIIIQILSQIFNNGKFYRR